MVQPGGAGRQAQDGHVQRTAVSAQDTVHHSHVIQSLEPHSAWVSRPMPKVAVADQPADTPSASNHSTAHW